MSISVNPENDTVESLRTETVIDEEGLQRAREAAYNSTTAENAQLDSREVKELVTIALEAYFQID